MGAFIRATADGERTWRMITSAPGGSQLVVAGEDDYWIVFPGAPGVQSTHDAGVPERARLHRSRCDLRTIPGPFVSGGVDVDVFVPDSATLVLRSTYTIWRSTDLGPSWPVIATLPEGLRLAHP